MVATVLADLVAEALLDESLMTEKLARRGLRVHSELEVDALRTVRVSEVMTPIEPTLHDGSVCVRPNDVAIVALEVMLEEGVESVPVVDGDLLVGVCTPATIIRARAERFEHEQLQPGWLTRPPKRRI
jgi:CBS-domain-containing membrane protein